MSSQPAVRPRARRGSFITKIVWFGFKLGFGLTSLASVWATAVLKNGALWAKDTEEEKRELAAAQQKYWSLDREPLPGFRHAFFTTSTGTQLHFVCNVDPETVQPKNVAIFIHGMFFYSHILHMRDELLTHRMQVSPIRSSSGAISSNHPNYSAPTS
jgi:hypothetical protein